MLDDSEFFNRVNAGEIMQGPVITEGNISFKPYLVADSGYPLRSYLMTPFARLAHITPRMRCFNFWHSSTRMIVERAFGQLKGRWRCLNSRVDVRHINRLPLYAFASCLLHNLCIRERDTFDENLLVNANLVSQNGAGTMVAPGGTPAETRNALADLMWSVHGSTPS